MIFLAPWVVQSQEPGNTGNVCVVVPNSTSFLKLIDRIKKIRQEGSGGQGSQNIAGNQGQWAETIVLFIGNAG